ncbi:MAG: DNA repair protein RecO [Gammaproteobacteria bacterium SHHR-1]|uniref:DNA repair protein RecO n=1 Tax=Magnetovirga frankeli TaxID=947516 RepID=UPI00129312F3|nr:DNA repair protein RecO [gamma proteobacterium SS-5]
MAAESPLEPAFVLSRRPYSNSSLLLELFAANSGRLALIARGARAQAGKHGGHLQPFVPLELAWSGRGEVKTLIRHEASSAALLQQGERLFYGYYLNELLLRLLPRQDASPELFALYARSLAQLAGQSGQDGQDNAEAVLRRFEVGLLAGLGYDLNLTQTVEGAPVRGDLRYHYAVQTGVLPAGASAGPGVSGQLLLALAGELALDDELLTEARPFMRGILRHYLGSRPLKSRELFRALYKRKQP